MTSGPSVGELFEIARRAPSESDARWDAVWALHRWGDATTFAAAADLMRAADPEDRELGVDVLAQLDSELAPTEHGSAAQGPRPYRLPASDLLLDLARIEQDPDVLAAIAYAFGHLEDPRAAPVLCSLATHASEDVRLAVARSLPSFDTANGVIAALIQLSGDPDEDVRDWATFGLGTMSDLDSPAIRAALVARLEDPHGDTLDEAIVGLAVRGDARAVEPLLRRIDDGWEGTLIDEALCHLAAKLADLRLREHVARRWVEARAGPDFEPTRRTDHEELRNAARRFGLAES